MTKLELIEQIIQEQELNTPNRKRELVYRRFYLFNELYKLKFTLGKIGDMFGGKNHATILHGIRQHKILLKFGYEDYKIAIKQIDDVLHGATLPFIDDTPDLKKDLLEAKNYSQFKKIQRHIKLGKYETK